jgi:hypothetical protein
MGNVHGVPQTRLVALLVEFRDEMKTRWVTYDQFERWRDRHPTMTPAERAALTVAVAEHMITSLATGQVRELPPEEGPTD